MNIDCKRRNVFMDSFLKVFESKGENNEVKELLVETE